MLQRASRLAPALSLASPGHRSCQTKTSTISAIIVNCPAFRRAGTIASANGENQGFKASAAIGVRCQRDDGGPVRVCGGAEKRHPLHRRRHGGRAGEGGRLLL